MFQIPQGASTAAFVYEKTVLNRQFDSTETNNAKKLLDASINSSIELIQRNIVKALQCPVKRLKSRPMVHQILSSSKSKAIRSDNGQADNDSTIDKLKQQLDAEADKLKMKIENHHEFLNDTIEVKIESLRQSLFDVQNSLKTESLKDKQKLLAELSSMVAKPFLANESKITSIQRKHKIKELHDELKRGKTFQIKGFSENKIFQIDTLSIGMYNRQNITHPFSISSNPRMSFINLYLKPRDILHLPGNRFVISEQHGETCLLIDSKKENLCNPFDLPIKSMTNDSNYIFTVDTSRFCRYDYNIKYIKSKSFLDSDYSFENICQICYYKGRIYATMDCYIAIFTDTFDFIELKTIENVSRFFEIKINQEVVCVSCCTKSGLSICFLRLSSFEVIASYSLLDPVIATYGDYFLTYNGHQIAGYDLNGNKVFVKELEIGLPISMAVANENLLVCLKDEKRIVQMAIMK